MINCLHCLSTFKVKMVNDIQIIAKDLQHIWHPCMQMKDFESCPPVLVHKAKGIYLETNLGTLLDGQSSWWCKSLGHSHPVITDAITNQLDKFEHVIAANTTHSLLAEFGETIARITGLEHQCFASDGSCAVEIAMKLAINAQQHRQEKQRINFIALENAYHGETIATLSVSDMGIYKRDVPLLTNRCAFIRNIPYVNNTEDPLWGNCEAYWPAIMQQLEPLAESSAALIIEPLLQGAGGMRLYSADFLRRLFKWARCNNIYIIADEIMTGIGRTGKWLAMDHAKVQADLVCLSKGLTGGAIPLSCVAVHHDLYNLFYSDYAEGKSFLHSHTHSANALGISVAMATLQYIEQTNILENVKNMQNLMWEAMHSIAAQTRVLTNIRGFGGMIAADLVNIEHPRPGFAFYQQALQEGALMRPLGQSIYWLPPLNTSADEIECLREVTQTALQKISE